MFSTEYDVREHRTIINIPSDHIIWRLYSIIAHSANQTSVYTPVFHTDKQGKLFFTTIVQIFKADSEKDILILIDEGTKTMELAFDFTDPLDVAMINNRILDPMFVSFSYITYQVMIEFPLVNQTEESVNETIAQFTGDFGKKIKINFVDVSIPKEPESKFVDVQTEREAEVFLENIKRMLYRESKKGNIN